MLPVEIIARKRDRQELSDEEIAFFIGGFSDGSIPDYQMSALAMAIFLNGMSEREIATLTRCMLESGKRLSWPDDGIARVDKHSTGGVGDKVSIPLAPLLAVCGLQVPMISGRGLGPTGGTLDKLESIPGFRTDLTLEEIQTVTQSVGCVITGASAELAPADRRLYALRDVTATVPSIPLITASIMSKKLAESLDALVLDVKFGSGAFMKTRERAVALAKSLVQTGVRHGVATSALITDMNQPLGRMCGNAVEIIESIDVLKGEGPADVRELTLRLTAELLVLSGEIPDPVAAFERAQRMLDSGRAYEKFCQMVRAQGGDPDADLAVAPETEIIADDAGMVAEIDTEQLGLAIIEMGGGRRVVSDVVDHSVGLQMLVRIGDRVQSRQPLMKVFAHDVSPALVTRLKKSIHIADTAAAGPLVVAKVGPEDAGSND